MYGTGPQGVKTDTILYRYLGALVSLFYLPRILIGYRFQGSGKGALGKVTAYFKFEFVSNFEL